MRTARLTAHLFTALLSLAAATMTLARMFLNMLATTRSDDMLFLLLGATLAYAAYSTARVIGIITEKKPS